MLILLSKRFLACRHSNCNWYSFWGEGQKSIPKKISDGIGKSDFLAVVLSNNSVKSTWVENEWQSKYYDEMKKRKALVLPILLQKCKIPNLLKVKKYADFTTDYSDGLQTLLAALR
jgi:thiamine monophosphate kinase